MSEVDVGIRDCDKALLDACSKLDEQGVLLAIEAGADVNVVDADFTPMIETLNAGLDDVYEDEFQEDEILEEDLAAIFYKMDVRRIRIFDILLSHGADINKVADDSHILWFAVHHGKEVLEYLLKNGADVNFVSGGDIKETPLEKAWFDWDAYEDEHYMRIARVLLSYGAKPYKEEDFLGESLDLSTIRDFKGLPEVVFPRELEERSFLTEKEGELFKACLELDEKSVSILLKEGCNPNIRNSDHGEITPLCMVVEMQSIGFPSLISKDNFDNNVQMSILNSKAYKIIELLLSYGANPNIEKLEIVEEDGEKVVYGKPPLYFSAVISMNEKVTKLLLEKRANPNFCNKIRNGETIRSLCLENYKKEDIELASRIENILANYNGCYTELFDDSDEELRDVDKALIYASQRLDFFSVELAEKLGGDLSIRTTKGNYCLPCVTVYQSSQMRGREAFVKNKTMVVKDEVEYFIIEYVLFLLVGMSVPMSDSDIDELIRACVVMGFKELLSVLFSHHSLGCRFKDRLRSCNIGDLEWRRCPESKRKVIKRFFKLQEKF